MYYKSIELLNKYSTYEMLHNFLIKSYSDKFKLLKNVMIFGTKEMGRKVNKYCQKAGINVIGFIDNNVEVQGKTIDGLMVYDLKKVPDTQEVLIIIATLNYMGQIEKQLIKNNITNYIQYITLTEYDDKLFPPYNNCTIGYLQDLIRNREMYLKIFTEIYEKKSLDILDNILLFRFTYKGIYLSKAYDISNNGNEEYFDNEIIHLGDNEVFVDGGSYLGETSLQFTKIVRNKYQKIYIFEPDKELINRCKVNLAGYPNIKYYQYGLGEERKQVYFLQTKDMGGHISQKGKELINIYNIDALNDYTISYIKLDIEGAEKDAILGAKNTISRNSPKLAISSYHKPKHLWQLLFLIKKINPTYDVFIRHYSEGIFETDFYYIKNKGR